jgi:hypothetical protein
MTTKFGFDDNELKCIPDLNGKQVAKAQGTTAITAWLGRVLINPVCWARQAECPLLSQ